MITKYCDSFIKKGKNEQAFTFESRTTTEAEFMNKFCRRIPLNWEQKGISVSFYLSTTNIIFMDFYVLIRMQRMKF